MLGPTNVIEHLMIDDFTGRPLHFTSLELLADLIILHINNAKLYEPFICKFENLKGYDQIVTHQTESVAKFLVLLNTFIEGFLKHCVDENFQEGGFAGGVDSNDESMLFPIFELVYMSGSYCCFHLVALQVQRFCCQ